jgi:uncharacterized protein YndB with AHSA1/START domain
LHFSSSSSSVQLDANSKQIGAVDMTDKRVHHGTVVVERAINVPIARAFAAYADASERVRWAAPSDTAVFIYDETDFRVGGRDVARCGAKDDPRFRVESTYANIEPQQCIVTTDTVYEGTNILSANVNTIEFFDEAPRTRVKITVQVTSFVGDAMIENTRSGNNGSLGNMASYLERSPS